MMPVIQLPRLAALVLVTGLIGAAVGCGDPPAPPLLRGEEPAPIVEKDAPPPTTPIIVEGETAADPPPGPPDLAQARQKRAARRREMDRVGRGLMTSFESRVLEPFRDAGLQRAEATVAIRVGEKHARVIVDFDHARELGERSVAALDPTADADAVPRGAVEQARKFGQLSMNGAHRHVAHYFPPTPVLLTPSRVSANRVVTAQPHKHQIQANYSIDDRDLVVTRGTTVDDATRSAAEIIHYEWAFFHSRYRLVKQWHQGGQPTIDYEWGEFDGIVLLRRATIRKDEASAVFEFSYAQIEKVEAPGAPKPR